MRLLALTATALLGTGCFVSSTNTTQGADVNVYWDFVRHLQPTGQVTYDGGLNSVNINGICLQSNVDTVHVVSAAGTLSIACTGPISPGSPTYVQGAVIPGLPVGSRTLTVQGFSNGTLTYESSVNVTVPALGNPSPSVIVDVAGVQAPFDLFADLFTGVTPVAYPDCTAAGNPNIEYTLTDSFGTTVAHATTGCSNPLPSLTFRDQLDLDSYRVRVIGRRLADNAIVFDACNQTVQHLGAQTGAGGFTANLFTNPVPVCP